MAGIPGSVTVGPTTAAYWSSAYAASPSAVLDAPGPVRALAAFVLVVAMGGALRWRYGAFVERSIDASMARPLSSLGYGVAAHVVIAFLGVYLITQLTGLFVFGQNVGAVGVFVGAFLVALTGSLGFVVVGSTLVEFAWGRRPWAGLLAGALVAAAAGMLDPVAGGVLWFVVVSMGIGGPARRWLHADAIREPP